MLSTRTVFAFGIAFATLTLGLTACSSDSSSTSEGNNTTGGSSGDNGSGTKTNVGGVPGSCEGGGDDTSSCTTAETEAYASCIQTNCGSTLRECYGPDYASGTYSGVCGDMLTCMTTCECSNISCLMKCPEPSQACSSCLEKVDDCSSKCTVPDCMKNAPKGDGDSAECKELADCCAGKSDEQEKLACESALKAAGGSALVCSAILDSLCNAN